MFSASSFGFSSFALLFRSPCSAFFVFNSFLLYFPLCYFLSPLLFLASPLLSCFFLLPYTLPLSVFFSFSFFSLQFSSVLLSLLSSPSAFFFSFLTLSLSSFFLTLCLSPSPFSSLLCLVSPLSFSSSVVLCPPLFSLSSKCGYLPCCPGSLRWRNEDDGDACCQWSFLRGSSFSACLCSPYVPTVSPGSIPLVFSLPLFLKKRESPSFLEPAACSCRRRWQCGSAVPPTLLPLLLFFPLSLPLFLYFFFSSFIAKTACVFFIMKTFGTIIAVVTVER